VKGFEIHPEIFREPAPGVAVTGLEDEGFVFVHEVKAKDVSCLADFITGVEDNWVFTQVGTDAFENLLFASGFGFGEFNDENGILQAGYAKLNKIRSVPGYWGTLSMGVTQ